MAATTSNISTGSSHPLALDTTGSLELHASGSVAEEKQAPPTYTYKRDTLRGSSSATGHGRPGYFDLQRLAAEQSEVAAVKTERSSSNSYPISSSIASSSTSYRLSDDGEDEEEVDDASDEDEEVPRWINSANSTVSRRKTGSRSSIASHGVPRGGYHESMVPTRSGQTSRNSMRSPPPFTSAFRNSIFHRSETPVAGTHAAIADELDGHGSTTASASTVQQFLTSIHLMTDEEIDRHLGLPTATQSSSRPSVSPLQGPNAASATDTNENRSSSMLTASPSVRSPVGTRSTSSFGNLEGMSNDGMGLRLRHKLLRDVSERLGATTSELDQVKQTLEQERYKLIAALQAQKKQSEAREQALREILSTMGVSSSRVDRALLQATSQAQVPTFKADGRMADIISRTERSVPADESAEEHLPRSIREAMLDVLDDSQPSSKEDDLRNLQKPRAKRGSIATFDEDADQTLQRSSPTNRSIHRRSEFVGGAKTPAPPTPNTRSGWGNTLMPWAGAGGASKKAAASIQATSPAAVEADGYFSDGPGKDASHITPSPSPHRRSSSRHKSSRSSSISQIMAQVRDESEDEGEDKKGWTDTASKSAFGLFGSLAWRRKKPDRSQTIRGKQATTISNALSKTGSPEMQVGSLHDQDTISIRSSRTDRSSTSVHKVVEEDGRNDDTVRAKSPLVRPQAQYTLSGRDVISALYEAIGSAPVSPEVEKQPVVGSSQLPKPSHFKAVCLATRIMTNDAGSVLLGTGKGVSAHVRECAMMLVKKARDEGKIVEEASVSKPSRRISMMASPGPSVSLGEDRDARPAPPTSAPTSGASSTTATLSRALARYKKVAPDPVEPNVTRLPQLFGQGSAVVAGKVSTNMAAKGGEKGPTSRAEQGQKPDLGPIVTEMEPILAHDVKPPTLASSARKSPLIPQGTRSRNRKNTIDSLDKVSEDEESSGDEFEVYGGKDLKKQGHISVLSPRHDRREDSALLTDRYGFVYDATPADVRLLRRARKEATHAPACLTGIRVGVRARGGTDSQSDEEKDDGDFVGPDSEEEQDTAEPRTPMANGAGYESDTASQRTVSSHKTAGTNGVVANSTVGLLAVRPAKAAVAEASTLSVPSHSSSSPGPTCPKQERLDLEGQTPAAVTSSNLSHAPRPPSTSQTVKRLLGQLQEMHKGQQADQQVEWDAFLRRRRATAASFRERGDAATGVSASSQSKSTSGLASAVRKSGGALGMKSTNAMSSSFGKTESTGLTEEEWHLGGMVGLSQMGSESKDYQDFVRLIQKGVPLVYRPKIWYECSGALDLNEPGKYQELLLDHENQENLCTNQIDLDIGRTMPTNIYFSGDGPGVPKLRRLLVAFSWYNPKCGYCQGMNNLAATLLLTHATEEEAFWVLVSIIERILPEEYYTSNLLASQADQRVLMDLMDEVLPNLSAHIRDLGVDLPAVTFAWFLSLYTDCLPVETLFRVWDVMFVDGMVVLFRIALAIFTINEKELLDTDSPSAFYSFVHSMTSHLFSVDRLIKLACEDLKSTVRKESILESRQRHIRDLTSELGLEEGPSPSSTTV